MENYSLSQSCSCHIRLASLRSPSSFLHTSVSVSFTPLPRNVGHRRRKISINIFHEEEDCNFFRRKSTRLLRSSSCISAFKLNSKPLQGLTSVDHMRKVKQMLGYGALSYSFLSILVGLGILVSIALAVLNAFAGKLRNANRAIIESMQTDLDGVNASIISMEMDFEIKMLNEKEEDNKKIVGIQEGKLYLLEKISMGKKVIADLGRELLKEKELADDLTFQFESARSYAFEAHQVKKELGRKLRNETYSIVEHNDSIMQLRSKIKGKVKTISNIQLLLPQKKMELVEMNTSIHDILTELDWFRQEVMIQMDQKLLRSNSELKTAMASFTNMTDQIISLSSERDNANSQSNDLHNRFKDLESICNAKQAARSKLLSSLNCEILHLKEHIKLALSELSRNQILESDLIHERDELKKLVYRESGISRNLQCHLQIMEETVKESREVALHIVSLLQQSENSCSKLKSKLLNTLGEFADSRESMEKKLNEVNLHSEVTKASINKTGLQLAACSELVNLHEKAKNLGWTMEEEKNRADNLNMEIVELERRIAEEKKPGETVEKQLMVANKSVDEMKRNMLLLSDELPIVYSRIDGLRKELKAIVSLIEKEKHSTDELKEEMEYANGIVDRLREDGKELKEECRKLEEELALAKGEILVVRS